MMAHSVKPCQVIAPGCWVWSWAWDFLCESSHVLSGYKTCQLVDNVCVPAWWTGLSSRVYWSLQQSKRIAYSLNVNFFFFLKQCLVITLILYNCFCKTLDLILIAFKITLGGVKKTHLTPHTLNVIGWEQTVMPLHARGASSINTALARGVARTPRLRHWCRGIARAENRNRNRRIPPPPLSVHHLYTMSEVRFPTSPSAFPEV